MLDDHYIIKVEFQSDIREINVESFDRAMFLIDSIQFYDKISLINSNADIVFLKENEFASTPIVEEPKKTKTRKTKVEEDTTEDDEKNV